MPLKVKVLLASKEIEHKELHQTEQMLPFLNTLERLPTY